VLTCHPKAPRFIAGGGERDATAATGIAGIGTSIEVRAPANTLSLLFAHEPGARVLVRRYAILLVVVLLCAASYFAGIWTGYGFHETRCITESPGVLVCGTDVTEPPSGSAPRPGDPRRDF